MSPTLMSHTCVNMSHTYMSHIRTCHIHVTCTFCFLTEPTHKQITVMVIKPDAVQAGKVDDILERVKSEGLEVLAIEEHQFTKEEAIQFYKQHEGSVRSLCG